MTVKVLGFSGHRDKLSYHFQLSVLQEKYEDWIWVQGGAPGFDQQVLELCRKLKIAHFTVRPDYDYYPPLIAPLERNKMIVDISSVMVFCYDGRQKGGTFQTRNYAMKALKAGNLEDIIYLPVEEY